jgi:hypothetical protein
MFEECFQMKTSIEGYFSITIKLVYRYFGFNIANKFLHSIIDRICYVSIQLIIEFD